MARPKNLVVLKGTTILSMSPSKMKEYLKGVKNGTAPEVDGTVVGDVTVSLDTVTADVAENVYQTLFGEPMDPPADEAEPAPTRAAAATPDFVIG